MFIIVLLTAVVYLSLTGVFGSGRKTALETDIDVIKGAIDAYHTESYQWPTDDSRLPPEGEYKPIDFFAGFELDDGSTMRLHPHFLARLPRHYDEGVWLLDYAALVSFDMDPDKY